MILFYYLLLIGEYSRKSLRNADKQTKQFKLCDASFFEQGKDGSLQQLGRDASDERILAAAGVMLKLDNQKKTVRRGFAFITK